MRCKRAQQSISAFLDGQLLPSQQARLNQHLAQCPACTEYLEDLRLGLAMLRSQPAAQPSANFEWNLKRKIQRAEAERDYLARQKPLFQWPAFTAAAAASLVICLAAAALWYTQRSPGESAPRLSETRPVTMPVAPPEVAETVASPDRGSPNTPLPSRQLPGHFSTGEVDVRTVGGPTTIQHQEAPLRLRRLHTVIPFANYEALTEFGAADSLDSPPTADDPRQ